MGEETAAAREVYERPGAVTRRAAGGEGTRRHSQRHGAPCSASLGKLTASFSEEHRRSVGAVFYRVLITWAHVTRFLGAALFQVQDVHISALVIHLIQFRAL